MNIAGMEWIASGQWAPERTGNYAQDTATGRAIAGRVLALMRDEENPTLFGHVVRAITQGGEYGAVEIGFCSAVGIELIGLRQAAFDPEADAVEGEGL